jgi:phospholipid/cholesterol/gamma-HCH transport system substrate-binding protein
MKISNEIKTGIVIVTAVLATATFYIKTTSFNPAPYKVKTSFIYADGVKEDSIVKLSGIEVGRVTSIKFQYDPETKVEMELTLDQKAKLHEDTIAFISTSGMIGDAYIGLTPGSASKPVIKAGGTVISEDPIEMRKFWKKADAIATSLDATLLEIKNLAANVNGLVTDNRPRVNSIMTNIEELSVNFKEVSVNFKDFSQDLKQHPWKLLMK